MLTGSPLHDDELVDALARDPRTGCLALWSVTVVFVLPGFLDHDLALLVIGSALGCAAAFASGRHLGHIGTFPDHAGQAQQAIDNSGLGDGRCTVFVAHSTCGM